MRISKQKWIEEYAGFEFLSFSPLSGFLNQYTSYTVVYGHLYINVFV